MASIFYYREQFRVVPSGDVFEVWYGSGLGRELWGVKSTAAKAHAVARDEAAKMARADLAEARARGRARDYRVGA